MLVIKLFQRFIILIDTDCNSRYQIPKSSSMGNKIDQPVNPLMPVGLND